MQSADHEERSTEQAIRDMLNQGPAPSHRELTRLSNLCPEDLGHFRRLWCEAGLGRRREVAAALLRLSENTSLNFRDVLICCLDDADAQVREAAIDALSEDESSALLERLMDLAENDLSTDVRVGAVLALARFTYLIETTDLLGRYREPLLELLLGIAAEVEAPVKLRRRAVETVAYLSGAPEVEEAIIQAYAAGPGPMRVSAVHAMGHHMAPRWRPIVERELGSAEAEMRYEAAYASGEMSDSTLVPLLAPLLQDADHQVARAAIWALGEIGGEEARRLLEKYLQQAEPELRSAVEDALHTIRFFEDPLEFF